MLYSENMKIGRKLQRGGVYFEISAKLGGFIHLARRKFSRLKEILFVQRSFFYEQEKLEHQQKIAGYRRFHV